MAEVTVDIDLREIPTDELVDELEDRLRSGDIVAEEIDLFGLTLLLKRLGVPADILTPLEIWEREPILTRWTLDRWNNWVKGV